METENVIENIDNENEYEYNIDNDNNAEKENNQENYEKNNLNIELTQKTDCNNIEITQKTDFIATFPLNTLENSQNEEEKTNKDKENIEPTLFLPTIE